jgi:hypothetical protein
MKMRSLPILVLLVGLALPAEAAVVHDEAVSGDLSSNPDAPTPLALLAGANTIIGSVSGSPIDRDFITFTIAPGQTLSGLNLVSFAPDNLAFLSFNAGSTSFVPSGATNGLFLAGIHTGAANVGSNLMPLFVTSSVTLNALPAPELPAGTYCFLIQQTSAITQSYTLEFVIQQSVPAAVSAWGALKALFE